MYKIPQTLTEDIQYTQSLIDKFKTGEITGAQLKSNRVPMGIYEQRENGHYMLRIRCTGGLITPVQLKKVAEVAKQVNCSHIHITTRQEVQIHDVTIDDATPALLELTKVGLATQGGGGNTIRNMLVNDLGGLTANEAFDPYPYAIALTTRLIAEKDSFTMPRKLKIAFDLSEETANFGLVADLGFIATVKNGEKGFRVLLGGSVASNPHLGWEIFDFLPAKDIFRAAKAAKNFFNLNGNRKNRYKARIRFIFYKNGYEQTKALYMEEYNKLISDSSLDLQPADLPYEYKTPSFTPLAIQDKAFEQWKKRYAYQQKQSGLFYAYIPVLHGNESPEFFDKIATFLSEFGNDVIRFTARQGIQVRNIPEAYLPNVYSFFKSIGLSLDAPVIFNSIASCTGADTCRLGICLPKGLVKAIRKNLEQSNLDLDAVAEVSININGCSNICAQSTWSDLGFSGRIDRNGDYALPAYTIWARTNGRKQLAESLGFLAARDIPSFVVDYLSAYISYKEKNAKNLYDDVYDKFVTTEGTSIIASLIEKYKNVPSFDDDKNYYYDWSAKEVFSITKHGQAECSAGLFDIVELDKSIIAEKRAALELGGDEEKILHDIVFSSSRMLLVTRGADPRTDDEVYDNFESLFIDQHLVAATYKEIVEKARKHESLIESKEYVLSLAEAVEALYATMDDSLQFKIPTVQEEPKQIVEEKAESNNATVKKDFRGVACPMNFVKTKFALAPMQSGQILEILLDDGQPINNVPGSVRNEGHEILETEKVNDYWRVVIKKK